MKKRRLISIDIHLSPYKVFLNTILDMAESNVSAYICVANVHMLIEAYRDVSFSDVVNKSDIVLPDGKPLTWALRFLYKEKQERVAGMDLLPDILSEAEKKQIPVGFYGGTEDLLSKTRKYLISNYPGIILSKVYSPPFRDLELGEQDSIVSSFNASGVKILFVVLGCPKQEKWMASMRDKINAVMIGIGGALPVLIGVQKRAPGWMQKSGLEWLFRLIQEPRRLFKRYATTNFLYIYLIIKEKIRGTKNG